MTTLPTSINASTSNTLSPNHTNRRASFSLNYLQPINCSALSRKKICAFQENGFKLRASEQRWSFLGESKGKVGILMREDGSTWRNNKRLVVVRANRFNFNGGGGGGGENTRLLGNLVFAIGLTYLSITGQLGWLVDTIVSLSILAVVLPIAGVGAFLWWAGRDIVQGRCPNCGNDFQIFKSSLKDGSQLCPFCTQPFSVEGDEFVSGPTKFTSNQSSTFGQAFNGFSPGSKQGKTSATSVVDVEAEVKDVD